MNHQKLKTPSEFPIISNVNESECRIKTMHKVSRQTEFRTDKIVADPGFLKGGWLT